MPEISHEIEGAVQIPHPERQRCQMPGVCPEGGGEGILNAIAPSHVDVVVIFFISRNFYFSFVSTS